MKHFIAQPLTNAEREDLAHRRARRKNRRAWKMIIRPLLVTTVLFALSQAIIMEALIQHNQPDPQEAFPVEEAIELCMSQTQEMAAKPLDFGNPFFDKRITPDGDFKGWSVEIPLWNQEDSKPAVTICYTDTNGEGLHHLRTQGLERDDLKAEFPPLLMAN